MLVEIFKTRNCPYCPITEKIVRRIAAEFKDIEIKDIYLDEATRPKAVSLSIRGVPTIVINGLVWRTGIPKEDDLREMFIKTLNQIK
jgi:glutaredoxin